MLEKLNLLRQRIVKFHSEKGLVVIDGCNRLMPVKYGVSSGPVYFWLQVRSYQSYDEKKNPTFVALALFIYGWETRLYQRLRDTRYAGSAGLSFSWVICERPRD